MDESEADGVAGQATINSVAPTGTMVNHSPVFAFDVTVTVPGSPAYRVEHTQMVSPMAIESFKPGATLPVRVALDDPGSLFLDV